MLYCMKGEVDRRRKISCAAVLDKAAREAEEIRLRKAVSQCIGTLASTDTHRPQNTGQTVRERLCHDYDPGRTYPLMKTVDFNGDVTANG
jgi:hypothetical protein